jgi:hypothetical protein
MFFGHVIAPDGSRPDQQRRAPGNEQHDSEHQDQLYRMVSHEYSLGNNGRIRNQGNGEFWGRGLFFQNDMGCFVGHEIKRGAAFHDPSQNHPLKPKNRRP